MPGGPPLPKALAPKPHHQPEFDIPANYFNKTTLNVLAATGRGKLAQLGQTLAAIQQNRYGVPASIVVAIWGTGDRLRQGGAALRRVVGHRHARLHGAAGPTSSASSSSLALKILEEGHATRAEMKSSWAGAMGYTQFLPTDFEKYAVDFDGDGRRDIWNSVPDALASTGNSLHSQGWDGAQTWGYEVALPKGFDCTVQGPDKARPICRVDEARRRAGAKIVRSRRTSFGDSAFLVLPAGLKGPAFLATNNFSVLKLYNNSDVYALFVGHVADMIAANAPAEFVGDLAAGRASAARPHPALPRGAGRQRS